jgi:sRNA-binding carbon storage regulator CsrA
MWGHFTAIPIDRQVSLHWTTLQENNTSCFIIEHATDSKPFTVIGTIPASGNSNGITAYAFMHTMPDLAGHNFYRLQQVDKDGRSTWSVTRTVQFDHAAEKVIALYPNPIKDMLQATVYENNVRITINTPNGKEVHRSPLQPGVQTINLSKLSAGIYYVTVYKQQQRITTYKIIKM